MKECLDKPPEFAGAGSEDHEVLCYLADHEYDPATALPEGYFEEAEDDV